MQAVVEKTIRMEPEALAHVFKTIKKRLEMLEKDNQRRETKQKVLLKLENERTKDQLNASEASAVEETNAPKNLNMKLNVITGQTFDTVSQGSKIQTIISVAGNQLVRN